MRKIFILCMVCFTAGNPATAQTGWQAVTGFGTNPGNLNMYRYVPTGITAKAPLVLALHGCTENATVYAQQSGWNKLADEHLFYVVYPEQNAANNASDCFNWFDPADQNRGQGEPLSIIQMVAYMKSHYNIDTTRIFVTGLSAGGCMTTVLLACYPDVFNAGAVMAGVPFKAANSVFTSEQVMLGQITETPQAWGDSVRHEFPSFTGSYPRVADFQGTGDFVVNQQNATEVMKQWTNVHGAGQTATSVNNAFNGNNIVTQNVYDDSTGTPVVETFFITAMPHGIALDTGTCYQQGGQTGTYALEVHLFSSFWAADFFGILGNDSITITGLQSVAVNQNNVVYAVPNTTGYTYNWTVPKGATIVSGQGSNQITVNFTSYSGYITVTASKSGNCEMGPAHLFVTAGGANCNNAVVTTMQTNSNVLCYGGNNGQATVHAGGAGAPFSYTWSTGGQTDSILSNVAAGVYSVTVTNSNACSATATVNITQPAAALTVTANPVAPGCYGYNNGSVTASASGGTGAYHYLWNTTPRQPTITAANLTAGSYTVTVTDADNCSATATATVNQPAQITASGTVTNNVCYGGNTGSIAVSASGGAGNYHYTWNTSPHQTTDTAGNLAAGGYAVTITDANNCFRTFLFMVTQPSSGIALSTSVTAATCGGSNGAASVNVLSGGTHTYAWSTGATTAAIHGIAAGGYTITVTDQGGCTATAIALVNSNGGPLISAGFAGTTCGNNNGSAWVAIDSGTGPFTYAWSSGGSDSSVINLAPGSYTVTVTDGNHCGSMRRILISASQAPSLSLTSVTATCGGSNGSASASVSGGTSPFAYAWSNGGHASSALNIRAGYYTVSVTDSTGCTATAGITVDSSGAVVPVQITANHSSICNGDSAQLCVPPGNLNYQWSNGANTHCILVYQTGSYTVTVTENGNCSISATPVQVQVNSSPQITITIHNDTISCSPLASYQWYSGGQPVTGATSAVYIAALSGNYWVFATDSNGCSATSTPEYVTAAGISNIAEENIRIYPNPSASSWQIELPAEWIGAEYELFDAGGRLVAKSEIKAVVTTVATEIQQGIYFVRINSGRQSIVRKVTRL